MLLPTPQVVDHEVHIKHQRFKSCGVYNFLHLKVAGYWCMKYILQYSNHQIIIAKINNTHVHLIRTLWAPVQCILYYVSWLCLNFFASVHLWLLTWFCAQQCRSKMCNILSKNIDCIDLDLTIFVKRCSIVISSVRRKLFGYYSPRHCWRSAKLSIR